MPARGTLECATQPPALQGLLPNGFPGFSELGLAALQPCPPSPSLPAAPVPHIRPSSRYFPASALFSRGAACEEGGQRAPPARGGCPETPAPGFGAWVGKGSIMERRAGSRIMQRRFIFCPLGGRLSPLPQITSHVTSWEA